MPKWTDEVVELLRIKWNAGNSAAQCTAELKEELGFDVSRNAVIGKVHRMGFPAHPTAVAHSIAGKAKRQRQRLARPRPQLKHASQLAYAPLLTPTPADVVYYKSVPFFELESHHCRYAVSGDNGREYQFCGNDRWKGSSYCLEHARVTSARVIASSEGRRFWSLKNKVPTESMLRSLEIKEESETP